MVGKSKDILLQILDDMEAFAKMKGIEYPPIYLLGGSGCINVSERVKESFITNLALFKGRYHV